MGMIAASASAATPTMEEMWALIQQQQAEIARLKEQVAQTDGRIEETELRVAQTNVKVEATAEMVEQGGAGGDIAHLGSWAGSTRLGGYGEMHYTNLDNDLDGGKDKDEIDFHRFVLYLSHEFSPRTRLYSELELEHTIAGEGKKGEVELEQAYIEHDLGGSQRLKAGLFLVPVGLLNETHEPDTFYGVERNNVERNIIPTTWWEGGVAFSGELLPGLAYDAAFTSGLGLDPAKGWKIRDGRQRVAEANASDPAWTGRLKYTGIAGLEVAATLQYQQDLYQGEFPDQVDAMLYETHVAYRAGPFGLRALYAGWDIDEAIEFFAPGADRQEGWYVEPSWKISPQWGVFARYSDWDNQAGSSLDTGYTQWDMGVSYWLEENVVFKFDYQRQDAPDGKDQLDGVNLGVGWSF